MSIHQELNMASSSIEINTPILETTKESVPNISNRLIRKLSHPIEKPTSNEVTIQDPTHTNPFLPTFIMMDIIHMMPLEKIMEVYEKADKQIPVKVLAHLLEGKLTFPTQVNKYLTGVAKSFTIGKYKVEYEERGESCVDGTFVHSFTDYNTSFYKGNHRFYMHNFRKASKQRLNFALPFGGLGVSENEVEIERTTEEYWDTYPMPEPVNMANATVSTNLPRPRASPFAKCT